MVVSCALPPLLNKLFIASQPTSWPAFTIRARAWRWSCSKAVGSWASAPPSRQSLEGIEPGMCPGGAHFCAQDRIVKQDVVLVIQLKTAAVHVGRADQRHFAIQS